MSRETWSNEATRNRKGNTMKYTYDQAQAALENGEIDGFSTGERVYAKKQTYIVRDDGKFAKRCDAGLHLLAETFSRSSYGFNIHGEKFTGSKKDFGTFPNGKVVLSTWKC